MQQRTFDIETVALDLFCQLKTDIKEVKRNYKSVAPEALITYQNGIIEWVEVISVFPEMHKNEHIRYAKALNDPKSSYAEFYYHFPDGYWKCLEKDFLFSVEKKNNNPEYQPFVANYGKGALILALEDASGLNDPQSLILPVNSSFFEECYILLGSAYECHDGKWYSKPNRLIPVVLSE